MTGGLGSKILAMSFGPPWPAAQRPWSSATSSSAATATRAVGEMPFREGDHQHRSLRHRGQLCETLRTRAGFRPSMRTGDGSSRGS